MTYTIVAIVALWIGMGLGVAGAVYVIRTSEEAPDERAPSAEVIRLEDRRAARERLNVGVM